MTNNYANIKMFFESCYTTHPIIFIFLFERFSMQSSSKHRTFDEKKMKSIIHVITILIILGTNQTLIAQSPTYDAALAEKYGADDYGMKSYFFVLLTTGDTQISDKSVISAHFQSHMDNIQKLVKERKLIVAGPFGKNENGYRGLFIMDVSSEEEARKLISQDGAVSSGLLHASYFTWYGSAALPAYLETAEKITKVKP